MYEKLQELMLYIAQKSQDDPAFGALKLNKILFFIDFEAYGAWGHPVSYATYVHRRLGPAPYELMPAQNGLLSSSRAAISEVEYFGKPQKRLVPLVEPNMSLFNEAERKLIDDAINAFKGFNGTAASDWTHTLLPWLDTTEGEEIPLFTTFVLNKEPITQEDINWGVAELQKIKGHV